LKSATFGTGFTLIRPDIVQFSEHEYAYAPVQENHREHKRGKYISRYFWAASFLCVKGLIMLDPEAEELPKTFPPKEVMLDPENIFYEDILASARSGKYGPCIAIEAGIRASLFEKCFHIAVGRWDYYFSSANSHWNGQPPVLVGINTTDERWK
jgi:hypothetical protein